MFSTAHEVSKALETETQIYSLKLVDIFCEIRKYESCYDMSDYQIRRHAGGDGNKTELVQLLTKLRVYEIPKTRHSTARVNSGVTAVTESFLAGENESSLAPIPTVATTVMPDAFTGSFYIRCDSIRPIRCDDPALPGMFSCFSKLFESITLYFDNDERGLLNESLTKLLGGDIRIFGDVLIVLNAKPGRTFHIASFVKLCDTSLPASEMSSVWRDRIEPMICKRAVFLKENDVETTRRPIRQVFWGKKL